jgi:hypothetical protein
VDDGAAREVERGDGAAERRVEKAAFPQTMCASGK